MSLRNRLLIGVLSLTAAGLAVVGFVSQAALRSYLAERLDQQVVDARAPVGAALFAKWTSSDALAAEQRDVSNGDRGAPPVFRRRGQGSEPQSGLPPGTYGELRNANGRVIARVRFSYGEKVSKVRLPDSIPRSDAGESKVVSAPAIEGSSGFRVASFAVPAGLADGSTVVVAVPEREFEQTLARLRTIELIVSAAVLLALAALTLWVIKLGLAPLERMQQTARAIAAGDRGRRVAPAGEGTEVGRLGLALNEMLARIEDAFAKREASERRLRQFLSDASHELRTPLSSIRGYAELFRIGMAEDREELETAMRRIEDESIRMGDLVEDLLTLARLDEMPKPAEEVVDMGTVAAEVCADARASAPGRRVNLRQGPGAMVRGDPAQLHQALANLLSNAVRHTPAGTPVEVALERSGPSLRVSVRDHGRGLPPGSEREVFDRFWRHDGARARADGGSGLGLAIVAAIVSAHGGSYSAHNQAGGGAVFVLEFPISGNSQEVLSLPSSLPLGSLS